MILAHCAKIRPKCLKLAMENISDHFLPLLNSVDSSVNECEVLNNYNPSFKVRNSHT